MTDTERQELYALMAHWGRDGDILYQKVREWIEGREASLAAVTKERDALKATLSSIRQKSDTGMREDGGV